MKLTQTFLITVTGILSLQAADPSNTIPEVLTPQPILGTYQILEQRIVQHDGFTVTYNRITPPQMSKVPAPVALPLTQEEQALVDSRRGKAHGNLSIGCTVFDHEVTELHWTSGGKRHLAYSNIDFNLVAGLGTFDSADTVYSSFLAVGNSTRASQAATAIPALSEFPTGLSIYLVPADDTFTEADNETLAALDALHAYYDANRAKLQQAYVEREQKRIAAREWAKDHPPVPKDEVMFIWKKEPATTTTSSEGGAK
jgi:hypothetical protein